MDSLLIPVGCHGQTLLKMKNIYLITFMNLGLKIISAKLLDKICGLWKFFKFLHLKKWTLYQLNWCDNLSRLMLGIKSGFDMSECCWVMTSHPAWRLHCHFRLPSVDECFCFAQDTTMKNNYFFKANTQLLGKMGFYVLQCPPVEKWLVFVFFQVLKKGYGVCLLSLASVHQTVAELWSHISFGVFAADFDWL